MLKMFKNRSKIAIFLFRCNTDGLKLTKKANLLPISIDIYHSDTLF